MGVALWIGSCVLFGVVVAATEAPLWVELLGMVVIAAVTSLVSRRASRREPDPPSGRR